MTIFKPTKADHNELILVWEAAVRATHHFLTTADILHYKQLILTSYFDQVELYGYKADGKIIGFMGLNGDTLQMLFIAPALRAKGIGKSLLQFAIKEKQVTKVDVNEQNQQAVGFYTHQGFKVMERFEHDDAGKPYPILAMQLQ